ncbi:hypothetical protein pb186bvf_014798 [Paramecium bursaria]
MQLKDSGLDYDTKQYHELMNNFENLLKNTQEKIKNQQIDICTCGLKEQLDLRNYEIQQLELQIKGLKNGDAKNKQYQTYEANINQKNQMIVRLEQELEIVKGQIQQEKKQNELNMEQFKEMQTQFEYLKKDFNQREKEDLQINDKISLGYHEIAQENLKFKGTIKEQQKQIDRLKLTLNQANLSILQLSKPMIHSLNQQTQTDLPYSLNDEQNYRNHLQEKIQNQQTNIDRFLQQFIEQKKLRNKSQNEVKFYFELQQCLESLKNENYQIKSSFNKYMQKYDNQDDMVQKNLMIAYQEIDKLKENNQKYQNDIEMKMKDQIEQQQREIEKLNNELTNQYDEVYRLDSELKEKSRDYQDMHLQLSLKTQELEQVETQFEFIKQNFEEETRQFKELIQQKEKQLNQWLEENKNLNNQQLSQSSRCSELGAQLEMKSELITSQHNQIQDLYGQLQDSKSQAQNLLIQNEKLQVQINFMEQNYQQIQSQQLNSEENNQQIYKKYAQQQKELGRLEEENTQIKFCTQQLQEDLQFKNQRLEELTHQLEELERQLFDSIQSSNPFERSIIENNYMSNKIDDMEQLLKDKDDKIDELEKQFHHLSYELRILQEYHQSLVQENEKYREQILALSEELEKLNIQNNRVLQDSDRSNNRQQNYMTQIIRSDQIKSDQKSNMGSQEQSPKKLEHLETVKVKILSGEIQRLNMLLQQQQKKIKDLQYFIEQMIIQNDDNRLLAKQILVAHSQKGQVLEIDDIDQLPEKRKSSSSFSFQAKRIISHKGSAERKKRV